MTLPNESTEQQDHLIIHNPDGSVTKMPMSTEVGVELRIGRELDNDIVLDDPRVSRHHAKVRRVSEDQLEMIDTGSANGTIIGATLIKVDEWQSFSPGQVAQIGDTRVVWEQAITSQSTVAMIPVSGPPVSPTPQTATKKQTAILPWAIGLVAILVLGIAAWLIFTNANQPAQSPEDIAAVTTPADIRQQTPQAAPQEADTATPEPTATIPLAPAQPRILIENIEFLPVISGALFDPQHVYLIVKVRVENLGDEPFIVSPELFRVEEEGGKPLAEFGQQFAESEFKRLGVTDRFKDLTLRSGGSVSEELVFFLEARPYQLTIRFLPADLTSLEVSLGTLAADRELAQLLGTPEAAPTVTAALAEVEVTATATPGSSTITDTTTTDATPTETAPAEPTATTTATPEPTATLTPPPPRADGFSRTVPSSSLVGTIAFPDFNGTTYDLYFGDVASGEVSFWRAASSQPKFSHDGSRIAYHSWAEGSRGLIASNLDHSGGFLVGTFLEDQLPAWSPDDSQLIFLSRRTGGRQSQFYLAPANQERPEAQLLLEGEYPTWHENGTLVFKGWETSGIGLRVADGDIADHESLTDNDADTAPSISPDGKQVVFMSRREGNWDIYLVNIDGSNLRRLTRDDADDGLPTWSPDGQAIAFVSNRGGPWAIWAMTTRGTGIRQLFTMQGSPDGHVASEPTTDTTRGWAEERISWK